MPNKESSYHRALLIMIILIIMLSGFMIYGNTINNGDYERVLCGYIFVPGGSQYNNYYQLGPGDCVANVFFTTRSLIERVLFKIHEISSNNLYSTNQSYYILSFIFFLGVYKLYYSVKGNFIKNLILFANIFFFILFSFLLRSFYEESSVIAFVPLLMYGYLQLRNSGNTLIYIISSSLILMSKTQMIYFAPLAIFYYLRYARKRSHSYKVLLSILILVLSALIPFANGITVGSLYVNQYDRFYNGMGWSLQDAGHWPAYTSEKRAKYFDQNQDEIQKLTLKYEPFKDVALLGTNFWGTGIKFRDHSPKEVYDEVLQPGSFSSYLDLLVRSPTLVGKLLKTTYLITVKSNYSLDHLTKANHWPMLYRSVSFLLGNIVYIWMIVIALMIFLRPALDSILFALYLLFSPVVVVIASGFFEFEKHLLTYQLLLPMSAIFYVRNGQVKPAMPQKSGDTIPASHASN